MTTKATPAELEGIRQHALAEHVLEDWEADREARACCKELKARLAAVRLALAVTADPDEAERLGGRHAALGAALEGLTPPSARPLRGARDRGVAHLAQLRATDAFAELHPWQQITAFPTGTSPEQQRVAAEYMATEQRRARWEADREALVQDTTVDDIAWLRRYSALADTAEALIAEGRAFAAHTGSAVVRTLAGHPATAETRARAAGVA